MGSWRCPVPATRLSGVELLFEVRRFGTGDGTRR
jgi:hypothetical protein